MTSEYRHTPVLLAECLEQLNLETKHTFVDATLGGAGHSFEIAKHLGKEGTLIGIDQDDVALAAARQRLEALPADIRPQLSILKGNFGQLDELLLRLMDHMTLKDAAREASEALKLPKKQVYARALELKNE